MDRFHYTVRLRFGAMSAFAILVPGMFIFQDPGLILPLAFMAFFFGLSALPSVIFRFSKPEYQIFLVSGIIGLSFIKLTIKLFLVDGKITKTQTERLKNYISSEFSKELGDITESYLRSRPYIEESIYSLCQPLAEMKLSYRTTLLLQLFKMVVKDEQISELEEDMIKKVARFMHIGKQRFYQVKFSVIKNDSSEGETTYQDTGRQQYKSGSKGYQYFQQFFSPVYNPFLILGLGNSATNDEIKKTYRELVKKFHPDVSMQKSELFRKKAMEKIQEINEAYKTIKKIRGIK